MAEQDVDLFFEPCSEPLTAEAMQFGPLFICEEDEEENATDLGQNGGVEKAHPKDDDEEEEEERFEDCMEELQTALGFSRQCRAAMEEEFSGLMAQMMAQIQEYDSLLLSATLDSPCPEHRVGGSGGPSCPGGQWRSPEHQGPARRAGEGGVVSGERGTVRGAFTGEKRGMERHDKGGAFRMEGCGGEVILERSVGMEALGGDKSKTGCGLMEEKNNGGGALTSEKGIGGGELGVELWPAASLLEQVSGMTSEAGEEVQVEGEVLDLDALGALFEGCIEEVGRLESRRDALVSELLELERPLAEGVRALRDELHDAHTQLQRCSLQKEDLRENMRLLKRQLFEVAKACAQSQVELSSRKHQVQQLTSAQEELQEKVQSLTEEASQLRSEHQTRLQSLQEQQGSIPSSSSSADLALSRRAPSDLQEYLQGALSALEEWYEPRLVALLKRREGGQEALRRAREQAQELKGQLGPLREESQRLQLQRACLEEKLRLMEEQRRESLDNYKETVERLEESSRELKMELQLQRRETKEMEALKNSLMKQLCLCRESEVEDTKKVEAYGDHSQQQPSLVEVHT